MHSFLVLQRIHNLIKSFCEEVFSGLVQKLRELLQDNYLNIYHENIFILKKKQVRRSHN